MRGLPGWCAGTCSRCHLELGRRALLKEHPGDGDSDQPGPCQLRLDNLTRAAASGCLQQTAAGHQGLLQVFWEPYGQQAADAAHATWYAGMLVRSPALNGIQRQTLACTRLGRASCSRASWTSGLDAQACYSALLQL